MEVDEGQPFSEQQYLDLLRRVTVGINRAATVEEGLSVAIETIVTTLGASVGHAWIRSDGHLRSARVWYVGEPGRFEAFRRQTEAMAFPIGGGLVGRAAEGMSPVWSHALDDPRQFTRADVAEGLATGLALPIVARSEVVGIIEFFCTERRTAEPQLLAVLQQVGEHLGRIIEREESHRAITLRELRYRELVETLPLGLFLTTARGKILAVNDACCRMLGYESPDALKALPAPSLYADPGERDLWISSLGRGDGRVTAETQLRRRDGSIMWGRLTVRETAGRSGFLGTVEDVTARREAERALEESHALLDALVRSSPLGIVVLDGDGTVRIWNPATEGILGWMADEVVGARPPIPLPEEVDRLLHTVADDQPLVYLEDARRTRKDGESIHVEVSVGRLRSPGEPQPGVVAFIRDITESRRLREEIRHTHKMEAIGRLAGGIAHDFNNLLTVVMAEAGLTLTSMPSGHPHEEALRAIQRAAEGGAALTRKLLPFARKEKLDPRRLRPGVLVGDMVRMLQRLLPPHVALSVETDPATPDVVVDPIRIEQVILNLVVNARDALPQGGQVMVRVHEVSAEGPRPARLGGGPLVALVVEDNGCGMSEDVVSRIFEPFFSTKEPGKGTGLGLATVYGIVRESGGDILVESAPARGSRFTVYLPAAP